jgi:hypothetical protein
VSPVASTHAQPSASNGVGRSGCPRSLHSSAARIVCVVRECGGGVPHAQGCPVGPGRSDARDDRSGRRGAVPSSPSALRAWEVPPAGSGVPGRACRSRCSRHLAASHRVNPSGLPVLDGRRVPVLQHRQPTRLGMPLPRGPVAARSMPRSPLTHGQRQAMPNRPDPGLQAADVRHETTPRQRPLIVAGLGDRPRPPGRRQRGQPPLPRRPRVRGMLQAVSAPRLGDPVRRGCPGARRPAAAPSRPRP